MRVGIDARLLYYAAGGISQYIRALIEALARIDRDDEFIVFQQRRDKQILLSQPNFRRRSLWTPCHHAWESWALSLELARARTDLLHSPDFISPSWLRSPAVVTIHDLAFLRFPQLVTGESRRYYGRIKRAVTSARGIIAVSENTRRDMTELLGVSPDRVDVIYHAADEAFRPLGNETSAEFCQRRGLPPSFILWVGTIEPRKNLVTLLKALAILQSRGHHYPLVVAGAKGWLYEETLNIIEDLSLTSKVILFGQASREDLLMLYNAAWVFAFPSLYEGFGLPPLEAMACGTPVISANTSSLPEVLGDAALLIDPEDVEAWADAIARLYQDEALRDELKSRGLAQSGKYSWTKTAEATLAVYRRVAGR
ncbi:MAG: glycosyltransferase family 4 protein [Chloroflexi bacterium]|nr:glycosyltransferase family 4 protein [Chloroflexota bacterium]